MNHKSQKDRKRWDDYTPGKTNSICLVIQDECIKGTDTPIDKEQSSEKAELFFNELLSLCTKHQFPVESFGNKNAMIDKFFRKSGQRCYSEKNMLEFAGLFVDSDTAPTIDDLKAWELKSKLPTTGITE